MDDSFLGLEEINGLASYRLDRPIGEGSMGTVFLAHVVDRKELTQLPDQVAIKILKPSAPHKSNRRKEISLMREILHECVVRVHDCDFESEPKFAVFDYYSGGSVADQFFREGPLPPTIAWNLLHDMLSALVATHRHGILHLDIKPGNILIGDDGRFLLSDFGVATGIFVAGGRRIVGSPAYMSPEQARGETGNVDARSDLFCLGTTMWHLIAGRLPVIRSTSSQVVRLRATEPLPLLIDIVDKPYHALAEIVDSMLAFQPRARPGSAAEVLAQLETAAETHDHAPTVHKGHRVDKNLRLHLRNHLSDPVLLDLLRRWGKHYLLRVFEDGEIICTEGEKSYDVYILLEGKVEVHRGDRLVDVEMREGNIIGEVAALIGSPRTAMLKAQGSTILALLKAAEIEQAAKAMPALAVRIMKSLAMRLAQRD